jgi:hypothetical protein
MASYTVRFPEQAAKSKSIVGEIDMDPAVRQGVPFQARAVMDCQDIGYRTRQTEVVGRRAADR